VSKFSGSTHTTKPATRPTSPLKVGSTQVTTHEGGTGFAKDDKTALYSLAVTNMVGEPTFYESANDRDDRFRTLVRHVAAEDPRWIAGFVPFLRNECNMRSASIVVAAEAVKSILDCRAAGAEIDASVRQIVASACSRPDEPAEFLGYWLNRFGKKIPMGVKRGIADAANTHYNERSALKYDGGSRGVRMGDVIELTHPKPVASWQSALFGHLLDRRHNHVTEVSEELSLMRAAYALDALPEGERRGVLRERGAEALAEAGYTWERLGGWIPGGMDSEAWEAIIPNMGYMALLRNLRNFEQAKVEKAVLRTVADKLSDPEEVAKSRQFPYRFFSAWKASGSTYFGGTLETALDESVKNIPKFSGKTLVAIDTSGSMQSALSARSQVECYEVAALFAASVASRSNADVIVYGTTWEWLKPEVSVLRTIDNVKRGIGRVGHGTNTWPSVMDAYRKNGPYDRIMVFTDMQDHPSSIGVKELPDTSIYVWDLRGHATANIGNKPGRHLFAGFSDTAFKMIGLIEAGESAAWPWME